jgi:hypothetical protein
LFLVSCYLVYSKKNPVPAEWAKLLHWTYNIHWHIFMLAFFKVSRHWDSPLSFLLHIVALKIDVIWWKLHTEHWMRNQDVRNRGPKIDKEYIQTKNMGGALCTRSTDHWLALAWAPFAIYASTECQCILVDVAWFSSCSYQSCWTLQSGVLHFAHGGGVSMIARGSECKILTRSAVWDRGVMMIGLSMVCRECLQEGIL